MKEQYFWTNLHKNQYFRYELAVEEGQKLALKKYYIFAILLGSVFFIMYSGYGIAFWYGSNLIVEGISSPGSIFTVNLKLIIYKLFDIYYYNYYYLHIGILQCNGRSIFCRECYAFHKFS